MVITPSEYVKHDVAQYAKISPNKIFVTHEAADRIPEQARPIARLSGRQFIMYVGRPLPHKNLRRLMLAFEQLGEVHPELMLVFVGRMDENYRRLALWSAEADGRLRDVHRFRSEGELSGCMRTLRLMFSRH